MNIQNWLDSKQIDQQQHQLQFLPFALRYFNKRFLQKLVQYTNLQILTLNNCCLNNLKGFPPLLKLIKLQLINNKLSDNSLVHLNKLQSLQFLWLSRNKIKSIECLKQLEPLTKLCQLDLRDNPIQFEDDYRETAFDLLKGLIILDNKLQNNKEFSQWSDSQQKQQQEKEIQEADQEDNEFSDADQK